MMKKATVLSQPPQRRRFTAEQKSSILTEIAAGETVASLTRIHEISESLIYNWRREAKKSSAFVRLVDSVPESAQFSFSSSLPPFRICLRSSNLTLSIRWSTLILRIAGTADKRGLDYNLVEDMRHD